MRPGPWVWVSGTSQCQRAIPDHTSGPGEARRKFTGFSFLRTRGTRGRERWCIRETIFMVSARPTEPRAGDTADYGGVEHALPTQELQS